MGAEHERGLPKEGERELREADERSPGRGSLKKHLCLRYPRRWPNKERWIEEKRAEAIWGDVRAYDADTLHAWLEQAPAVHIWLSRHMGKQPPDAIDLETYWEDWSGVTNPPFSVPLVIGGRQAEASRLLEWISGVSTLISLQAETEQEAIAFLAASIQGLPTDDRDRLFSRSAVVMSEESWRQISFARAGLVLVPQLPDVQAAPAAVGRGHHVLVPLARNHPTDQTTIELPAVDRNVAREALVSLGFDEAEADELASLAWRGLAILRRRLAMSPALMVPTRTAGAAAVARDSRWTLG